MYIDGKISNNTITQKLDKGEHNITIILEDSLTKCENMFKNCKKIINITMNLSDISCTNMNSMFNGLSSLTNIDFISFNTSKVQKMNLMFNKCEKLISLNLSNFIMNNVENAQQMFQHCSSLIYIDVYSFMKNKIINMRQMFGYCYELLYLDLSNFDTSHVTNMY